MARLADRITKLEANAPREKHELTERQALIFRILEACSVAAHLGGWRPGVNAYDALYAGVEAGSTYPPRWRERPFEREFGDAVWASWQACGVRYVPYPRNFVEREAWEKIGEHRGELFNAFEDLFERHPELNLVAERIARDAAAGIR